MKIIQVPTLCALKKWHKNKGRLKKELIGNAKEISDLVLKKESLEHKLRWIEKISFFHQGTPIQEYLNDERGSTLSLVLRTEAGMRREAKIYLNAHNQKTWGIVISEWRDYPKPICAEQFLGNHFASRHIVRTMALEFLVSGKIETL